MSIPPTPDQGTRSPKRKRSESSKDATPQIEISAGDDDDHDDPAAALDFAYEDEMPSELQSPAADQEPDGAPVKRQKIERPRRLNYVPYMTLKGHKRGVAQVKFSPDGKWIASCSADASIKIWDSQTGALIHTLEGHLAGISTIAWSPDSKVVASGSDDKMIRLWDVTTGKCMPSPLVGHHNYVYSLAFSPKGNMLVSGSYDEAVFLWDVRTARLMRSLPAHSDPVSGVDFVRDGTLIASCASDGLIRIWDTSTGQCLKTLVHEDNAPVTSVRFSPNGKYVLASTLDSCVRLWNYVEGRCLKTYQGHENKKYSINTAFGTYTAEPKKQGKTGTEDPQDEVKWAFAAGGSDDGRVMLWDVSSKEVLQELKAHDGVVLGIEVGLDDQTMLTCGNDKTIKVWKRRTLPAELAIGSANGLDKAPQLESMASQPVTGDVTPAIATPTAVGTPAANDEG
ncbi:hypothetical protein D0865_08434 [Hortaea werneckii]|uniref:Mitochondrial division protein 1 n=1 Tax=Hortaea werneckii TaxID=91943 RepID=A0A3M7C738_HORWE|nr:hypothetical protein D0865_08434 [Hortaea werneckii]